MVAGEKSHPKIDMTGLKNYIKIHECVMNYGYTTDENMNKIKVSSLKITDWEDDDETGMATCDLEFSVDQKKYKGKVKIGFENNYGVWDPRGGLHFEKLDEVE